MSVIVVTGASGFLGRRVVERLAARGDRVVGVARRAKPADLPSGVDWVSADLGNPGASEAALAKALGGADVVLHLAAVTGKARPAEYRRGNIEATEALLRAAERAGVGRFVFVSSIAVSFADRRHYPYSDSKAAAEAIVRSSSLKTTIVRPTMILGAGSPIQESLEKLARLPVAPMFGDGKAMVNPIEVDDVAALLVALAHEPDAAGAVIEVGGPAAYPMSELFARLRAKGGAPKFIHLPLKPLRELLALVEGPLLPLMPLTAGQLASFANDGVAKPSPLVDRLLPTRSESPAGPASAAAA